MGSKSAPAPLAPQQPVVQPAAEPAKPAEPANRAVAQRADSNAEKANLLGSDLGPADVDPLSQRKALTGGANLMG